MITPVTTYERLEREWLDRGDGEHSQAFGVVRAILMLAAEVKELHDLLDVRLSSLRDGQAER